MAGRRGNAGTVRRTGRDATGHHVRDAVAVALFVAIISWSTVRIVGYDALKERVDHLERISDQRIGCQP